MIIKCITTKTGVCDSDLSYRFITLGKVYQTLDCTGDDTHYYIINDNGDKDYFNKTCFVGIDEIRNDKLNQLGI
jgi:hypothetical protein